MYETDLHSIIFNYFHKNKNPKIPISIAWHPQIFCPGDLQKTTPPPKNFHACSISIILVLPSIVIDHRSDS